MRDNNSAATAPVGVMNQILRCSVTVAAVLQLGCGTMGLFGARLKMRELEGVGSVTVPARLENRSMRESPAALVIGFYRSAGGSYFIPGVPTRRGEHLAMVVGAPGGDVEELRKQASIESGQDCNRWKAVETGPAMVRVETCVYEWNGLVEPMWVVSGADAGRDVAMSYRVFQKSESMAKAVETFTAAMASFKAAPGLAAKFEELRERPLRDERAAEVQVGKLFAWFQRKGWPVPRAGETIRHGNCAYRWEPEVGKLLTAVCQAGSRPAANRGDVPDVLGASGALTLGKYAWTGEEWMLKWSGQDWNIAEAPWAAFENERYDRERVYYFVHYRDQLLWEGVADSKPYEETGLEQVMAAAAQLTAQLER